MTQTAAVTVYQARVDAIIASMPELEATSMRMVGLGFSTETIAEVTGLSVGEVRSALDRAVELIVVQVNAPDTARF